MPLPPEPNDRLGNRFEIRWTARCLVDAGRTICLVLVLALAACEGAPGPEVSSTAPYRGFIGAEYRVVGDNLRAFGVYASMDEKTTLRYIFLRPPGIGGSEFAFERPVPKGQVLEILGAWRLFRRFERTVYYLVKLENSDLPPNVPIQVRLQGDNAGAGGDLNPAIFERLPTKP